MCGYALSIIIAQDTACTQGMCLPSVLSKVCLQGAFVFKELRNKAHCSLEQRVGMRRVDRTNLGSKPGVGVFSSVRGLSGSAANKVCHRSPCGLVCSTGMAKTLDSSVVCV